MVSRRAFSFTLFLAVPHLFNNLGSFPDEETMLKCSFSMTFPNLQASSLSSFTSQSALSEINAETLFVQYSLSNLCLSLSGFNTPTAAENTMYRATNSSKTSLSLLLLL